MSRQTQNEAVKKLEEIAEQIYEQINEGKIPAMKIPVRTKNNIVFDIKHGVWKYGNSFGHQFFM
jgi:DNA topoisomerase VI subunit A